MKIQYCDGTCLICQEMERDGYEEVNEKCKDCHDCNVNLAAAEDATWD